MAKSNEFVGRTIVHYLTLALERSGVQIGPDMRSELEDIVETFTTA